MNYQIFRLKFKTPLHISNVRSDYAQSETIVHSDTLYSAIFEAWNQLGMTDYINQQISQSLKFTLSSLFPYTMIDRKEYVYFFPKPLNVTYDQIQNEKHKEAKRIEYIDLDFLERYRKDGLAYNYINSVKGIYLTDRWDASHPSDFMVRKVYPRVTIPRDGGDSQPYYVERISFKQNSGLYFIARFDDNETKKLVLSALKYLADEGIGTDRHVGNGLFDFEEDTLTLTDISSEYAINLSLYCPESHETVRNILDDNKVAYEIITRGGWITTHGCNTLRKKYIRMFKEGSILKLSSNMGGKIVDITPDIQKLPDHKKKIHPIYRIGKAIFLNVNC